jgi:ABC-type antimicrobial peptide transport system permease subunit
MKAGLVDESYAGYEKDILLVSRTVSAFGVVAFVVAMTGIYGVMAFIVAGRRREIGIRMALGADRRAISRLVIGSSLRLTLIGVGVGLVAALAASRFIQSHLFGITSTDPSTYGLVGVLIAATAIVATWHPARQACRVDPAVTLRAE